jgi:hypothetical protein
MAGQSLPSGAYRGIDAPGASAHLVVWKKATGENFWYAVSQIQIDEGDVPQYWYITVQRGVTTDTDVYVYLQYGKDSPSAELGALCGNTFCYGYAIVMAAKWTPQRETEVQRCLFFNFGRLRWME